MIDGINIPEYEVTQFNQKIKDVVESNFTYVRIRGEVSQLKSASSGHIYLTLKDENSVLNATICSQKKNYLHQFFLILQNFLSSFFQELLGH